MDSDKTDRISRRAYALWEAAGRPHGQHDEHWLAAEKEFEAEAPASAAAGADGAAPDASTTDPHPGMMGDGTEEQNLDQPGDPKARITEEEVEAAFAQGSDHQEEAQPGTGQRG